MLQSATGWVREFGIDGLRLDAIYSIFDSSPEHIVAAIAQRFGARADDVAKRQVDREAKRRAASHFLQRSCDV